MPEKVTAAELRSGIHHVLQDKENQIQLLRQQHEKAVGELYGLLSRKRTHGSAFPAIDLEDVGIEDGFESLDDWRRKNNLDIASGNAESFSLPSLPPPSPPVGVTIFPDEPAGVEPPLGSEPKEESAPSPVPTDPRRPVSTRSTPAVPVPPVISPAIPTREPIAGPSRITRSPSPPMTVSMSQVQARSRRVYSPSLPPSVPDWKPSSNYAVAEIAPSTPPHALMPLQTDYTEQLPALPPVPTRSAHRRKRKDSKGEEGPADLYKLQASYEINPVSGSLAKSSKIVLTTDWRVALAEMRHIRAMERIEQKKENGRWSLRQPKKLKAPPVRKSHWDYLLEEMEWMRLDYAEERRWKRVLAREFAYQIVEWHLSTPADKAAMMIGERGWGTHKRESELLSGDIPMEQDEPGEALPDANEHQETSAEVLEEMLPRRGRRGRGRPKEPIMADDDKPDEPVKDIEQMEVETKQATSPPPADKTDEPAEVKDEAPAQSTDAANVDADADGEADAEGEIDDGEGSADIVDGVIGLEEIASNRDNATDPEADAEGEVEVEPEPVTTITPRGVRLPNGLILSERFKGPEQLSLIRAPLLDSSLENAFADMPSMETQIALANGPLEDDRPLSLEELFPDLAPYAGPTPPEGEHSPKRLEEGHMPHHRPAHTSRIMDLEPLFVSMLQPGKATIDGAWDLHDGPWYEDPKGSTDMTPEAVAATSSIFHGRTARLPAPSQYTIPKPALHHLRPAQVWSPEEDELLKRLVSMYPFNWQLIADNFNSQMLLTAPEKRHPYDCFERWDMNFGPDSERKKAMAAAAAARAASASNTAATAATANTSAAASGSITPAVGAAPPSTPGTATQPGTAGGPTAPNPDQQLSDAPPPPGLSKREAKLAAKVKYEGTKKAIRHQALYDCVRRIIRRRETSKQKSNTNPKQVINIHESHSTYLAMPILDPSTLSNQKHQADLQRQMQQQQQFHRTQYMQDQHRQRMNQAAMAQAANQSQQGRPVAPGPPGQPQPMPPQVQGQGQPQPPRMGPNGQPMPPNMNIGPNQQMILGAVAAATAANRQNGSATPGGTARPPPPLPPQQARGPPVQQGSQPVPMQQMQHVEAQMRAAQMMQAQAQQAQDQRIAGTPLPQAGTLAASPYQTVPELAELVSNGIVNSGVPQQSQQHMHIQTSPAAMTNANMHSSPQSQAQAQLQAQAHIRATTMPMASTPHLRASSSSGSPQMGNTVPQQSVPQQINQRLMSQIAAQITANGGQPTTEAIQHHMQQYMRNLQAAQSQQQQQQQQQQVQMGTPQMGTPQMAMQGGVPHFARSPSVPHGQIRHSPSQ